ncbi:hypothetical protein [Metallosphaera sedula]|nr:hypothetical protein [Metallosphaera prunae]MCY0862372.1 hypothetical protein [Metallosphaera prunae]
MLNKKYASELSRVSTWSLDKKIEVVMDVNDTSIVLSKLRSFREVTLYPLPTTLKETLEVGGALRESGIRTSIEGYPFSVEPRVRREEAMDLPNVALIWDPREPTWNMDTMVSLGQANEPKEGQFIIGRDFPITDPRTGVLAYFLKKTTYVQFKYQKETLSVGEVNGEIRDEEYLIRPNKWMTDMAVVRIKEVEKREVTVNSWELFCRPLGSVFVPVNKREMFNVMIGLKMRSGHFPLDCMKYFGEVR